MKETWEFSRIKYMDVRELDCQSVLEGKVVIKLLKKIKIKKMRNIVTIITFGSLIIFSRNSLNFRASKVLLE